MKNVMRGLSLAILAALLLAMPALAAEEGHGGAENPFAGDLGNAIWTLVIFVLVIVVLGKFAWGPILSQLQAREAFIRDSLAQARADRDAAEARLKEYEAKLAGARAEATALVDEGRRDAEVVKARLEATGKQEAEKMIARAKREIEIATQTAVKDLYSLAGRLATDAASRIIRQELNPQDHERLIAEAIERIEATGDPTAH